MPPQSMGASRLESPRRRHGLRTPRARCARGGGKALPLLWVVAVAWVPGCAAGDGAARAPDACVTDADCDDGIGCTEDLCVPSVDGVRACQHAPRNSRCAAGEQCMVGGAQGCLPASALPCAGKADGAGCTSDDACASGPGTCNAGTCVAPRRTCVDESACRITTGCDAATGECLYAAAPDQTPCGEGLGTCEEQRCISGACQGVPRDCDDHNECSIDSCDSQSGCRHVAVTGGDVACDDHDACTADDRCVGVTCTGHAVDCDDHDACTADSCDPATGCAHQPAACCGDGVVAAPEECDLGPSGLDLCAQDCTFAPSDLTQPSAPGRAPGVGWSAVAGAGLVAWEATGTNGMDLHARLVHADASEGKDHVLTTVAAEAVPLGLEPAVATLPGGRFLLAAYQPVGLGLWVVDPATDVVGALAGPTETVGQPGAAITAASSGSCTVVAWNARAPDADVTDVLQLAVLTPAATPVASPARTAWAAGPGTSVGRACGAAAGVLVPAVRRVDKANSIQGLVVSDAGVVGAPFEVASFTGESAYPPMCAASKDGGFLVVWVDPAVQDGIPVVRLRSERLDAAGQPAGTPATVLAMPLKSGQPAEFCLPWRAALLARDAGFVVASPWAHLADGQALDGLALKWLTLDGTGAAIGTPEAVPTGLPAGSAADPFEIAVAGAAADGGPVLLAWQVSAVAVTTWPPPPSNLMTKLFAKP